MKRSYELKYHKLEENHWWFTSRRDIVYTLIQQINPKKNARILDVGCSGGSFIKFLNKRRYGQVFGIDKSERAIAACKKNGVTTAFVMDGSNLSFHAETFDLIIASDILEHIKKEGQALGEWKRVLKAHGKLIVFVPAFNFLWSKHDEENRHYRRYRKSELVRKLERAHFRILKSSYSNFSIFIPAAIVRLLQRIIFRGSARVRDQLFESSGVVNKLALNLLHFENWFLKHMDFPLGVSVFAICSKSSSTESDSVVSRLTQ